MRSFFLVLFLLGMSFRATFAEQKPRLCFAEVPAQERWIDLTSTPTGVALKDCDSTGCSSIGKSQGYTADELLRVNRYLYLKSAYYMPFEFGLMIGIAILALDSPMVWRGWLDQQIEHAEFMLQKQDLPLRRKIPLEKRSQRLKMLRGSPMPSIISFGLSSVLLGAFSWPMVRKLNPLTPLQEALSLDELSEAIQRFQVDSNSHKACAFVVAQDPDEFMDRIERAFYNLKL